MFTQQVKASCPEGDTLNIMTGLLALASAGTLIAASLAYHYGQSDKEEDCENKKNSAIASLSLAAITFALIVGWLVACEKWKGDMVGLEVSRGVTVDRL